MGHHGRLWLRRSRCPDAQAQDSLADTRWRGQGQTHRQGTLQTSQDNSTVRTRIAGWMGDFTQGSVPTISSLRFCVEERVSDGFTFQHQCKYTVRTHIATSRKVARKPSNKPTASWVTQDDDGAPETARTIDQRRRRVMLLSGMYCLLSLSRSASHCASSASRVDRSRCKSLVPPLSGYMKRHSVPW